MSKPFDLVVYGASGFTGQLVAAYLLQHYPQSQGLRWALAGRSADKLAAVRDALGAPADTPLLVADSADAASVQAMTAATRLVLTTVGPYQLYGSEIVAACAASGTDYVDLCGEPAWMHAMIDAHAQQAKASGARIVFSCGFDSIPFDLGVLLAQQECRTRYGVAANRIRGRVRRMKGQFSGGTAASLQATLAAARSNPAVLDVLRNPFSLTPGFTGPSQPVGNKPFLDEAIGLWVAPFVMGVINTRNVHRSNFLLGHPYGTDFVYDEMMVTGAGAEGEARALALANEKSLGGGKDVPPGEGPSQAERDAGYYDLMFLAHTPQGQALTIGVQGQGDPGYGSTSKMVVEAALCLLNQTQATPGGIWTPASALGLPLIDRLQAHAGLRFAVEAAAA